MKHLTQHIAGGGAVINQCGVVADTYGRKHTAARHYCKSNTIFNKTYRNPCGGSGCHQAAHHLGAQGG